MRLAGLLLLVIGLTSSCVHTTGSHKVRQLDIVPGVTTKDELIRQLGAPRGFRLQGEDSVLTFSYTEGNGSGYGLGLYVISLGFENIHAATDTLEVVVGPDRVVRTFRLATVPRKTPKWPSWD